MYFSSKGLNGFGGYDIYKTTGSSRTWTETVPLPQPGNTLSQIPHSYGFFGQADHLPGEKMFLDSHDVLSTA